MRYLLTVGAVVFALIPTLKCQEDKCNFLVSFGQIEICPGEENRIIPLSNFQSGVAPKVVYSDAKNKNFYTLLMLDPDAPNHKNPVFADWLHLGVANIDGKVLKKGIDLSQKNPFLNTFMTYAPPTPPPNTGLHRYEFILLEEGPNKLMIDPLLQRAKFNRKMFLSRFEKVEEKSAFRAEHDK